MGRSAYVAYKAGAEWVLGYGSQQRARAYAAWDNGRPCDGRAAMPGACGAVASLPLKKREEKANSMFPGCAGGKESALSRNWASDAQIRFVEGADDGGDHGCEGDFSKEGCGAVERG